MARIYSIYRLLLASLTQSCQAYCLKNCPQLYYNTWIFKSDCKKPEICESNKLHASWIYALCWELNRQIIVQMLVWRKPDITGTQGFTLIIFILVSGLKLEVHLLCKEPKTWKEWKWKFWPLLRLSFSFPLKYSRGSLKNEIFSLKWELPVQLPLPKKNTHSPEN